MKSDTLRLIAVGVAACLIAGPAHADAFGFQRDIPDNEALRQYGGCGLIAEGETPTAEERRKIEECRRKAAQQRREDLEEEWDRKRRQRIERSLARDEIYGYSPLATEEGVDPADVERMEERIDDLERKLRELESDRP
jgi:polyhydroxyalkanoate synthesis regulator phasin